MAEYPRIGIAGLGTEKNCWRLSRPRRWGAGMSRRAVSHIGACFLVLLLLGGLGVVANAQTSNTGALAGVVSDTTGAILVNAQVRVTNSETGESRVARCNESGRYVAGALPPGQYKVEVTHEGFKTAAFPAVAIIVAETVTLNISMEPGAVSEKITVHAEAEQLQTETSTLGRVTSGMQVEQLPLVSRNFTQIVDLNPGVASNVTNAGALGKGGGGTQTDNLVSGAGTSSDNNFQMDGVPVDDLHNSGGNFSSGIPLPNPDTIQEFKVQTSQYDATFGRNAGANIDIVTRGGSNEFHGALWEFFRNDFLNANEFFNKAAGQPRPALKQNTFGFTLGGPIRKDKLLFFTSYEGTRQRNGVDPNCFSTVHLPPLTNDRSALALGTLFEGQRGYIQDLFGGVGPAIAADGSNINPVALAILQRKLPNGQYVVPSAQIVDPDTNHFFDFRGTSTLSVTCPYTENQFMTNADFQQSDKSKFSGRFFFSNTDMTQTIPGSGFGVGTNAPGWPVDITNNYRAFSLIHSYLFGPGLYNEVKFGFHRTFNHFAQQRAFGYGDVGATVVPFVDDLPQIVMDFTGNPGPQLQLGGNGQNSVDGQSTYSIEDLVFWVHGRHNVRLGGGYSRVLDNHVRQQLFGLEGYLTWADFLLGLNGAQTETGYSNLYASLDIPGNFDRYYRQWGASGYIQDDFKVTQRLSLNFGLRFEHLGDLTDTQGHNASFNASLADPNPPPGGSLAGYVVPSNYPGPVPAGVTKLGNPFGINGDGQNTWNPRLGFSWRLPRADRMVLRGGYGIYRSTITGQVVAQNSFTSPPFAFPRLVLGAQNAAATEQVPFSLDVPTFPVFPAITPDTVDGLTVLAPNVRPPMIQQYSLGLQTEVASNLVLEVGYSGARSLHLLAVRSINQAQLASPANPIRGQSTNIGDPLNPGYNVQLRVPYEGWSANNFKYITSEGAAWYNALLVSLTKRFSHGLQFQAAYTFAKDLSTEANSSTWSNSGSGGLAIGDQNNPRQRYGPDDFIRPHRFIVNYVYEFPSPAKGTSLRGELLGGWSWSGVVTVQAGEFQSVLYQNNNNVFGITNDRASLSGTCQPGHYVNSGSTSSKFNNYLNASCFTTPAVFNAAEDPNGYGFGNAGIGIFQGPGQFNWDTSVSKHFALGWPTKESSSLEFRAEAFNAFNHPQFGNPSNSFSSVDANGVPQGIGQITTTTVAPRIFQFALKLKF